MRQEWIQHWKGARNQDIVCILFLRCYIVRASECNSVASTQITDLDFLSRFDLRIQKRLKLLVCKKCQCCLTPKTALDHHKTHLTDLSAGYKRAITVSGVQAELNMVCENYEILHSFPEVSTLPYNPVAYDGLAIQDGYQCTTEDTCTFVCTTRRTQEKHIGEQHRGQSESWINCKVQQLGYRGVLFRVQACAVEIPRTSYSSFMGEYLATVPNIVPPPNADHTRDLPPYIITKGIYTYLQAWYEEPTKRTSIVNLYKMDEKESMCKALTELCHEYITSISLEARTRPYHTLKPFEVYPMYVEIRFKCYIPY